MTNPVEEAWLALKAAGRTGPVGRSKTDPTYSQGPLSNRHPRKNNPMASGVAEAGGPGEKTEPEPETVKPKEGRFPTSEDDPMWRQLLEQWVTGEQRGEG